jgi:hypothetical protein
VATQPQPIGKIIFDIEPWMLEWVKLKECGSVLSWLRGLVRNEKIAMEMNEKLDRATFCKARAPERGETGKIIETKGNDHAKTKMRPGQVQRLLHLSTEMTHAELAARFNISVGHVRRILARRENGTHVEIPEPSHGRGSNWRISIGGHQ